MGLLFYVVVPNCAWTLVYIANEQSTLKAVVKHYAHGSCTYTVHTSSVWQTMPSNDITVVIGLIRACSCCFNGIHCLPWRMSPIARVPLVKRQFRHLSYWDCCMPMVNNSILDTPSASAGKFLILWYSTPIQNSTMCQLALWATI